MHVRVAIVATVVALGTVAVPSGLAAQGRGDDRSRQRPAEGFACNPDNLTSFTGVVAGYSRQAGRTTLRIRTDWDTTEDVTIAHPGTDDPSAFFRYEGRAFTPADWSRVEREKGVLQPARRATAWVCADGKVLVDWAVPSERRR
ncbi:MAG: hypothetical protein AB7H96_16900 [Vicinamibacterales bacterium]